jgi:hypothetical protein
MESFESIAVSTIEVSSTVDLRVAEHPYKRKKAATPTYRNEFGLNIGLGFTDLKLFGGEFNRFYSTIKALS